MAREDPPEVGACHGASRGEGDAGSGARTLSNSTFSPAATLAPRGRDTRLATLRGKRSGIQSRSPATPTRAPRRPPARTRLGGGHGYDGERRLDCWCPPDGSLQLLPPPQRDRWRRARPANQITGSRQSCSRRRRAAARRSCAGTPAPTTAMICSDDWQPRQPCEPRARLRVGSPPSVRVDGRMRGAGRHQEPRRTEQATSARGIRRAGAGSSALAPDPPPRWPERAHLRDVHHSTELLASLVSAAAPQSCNLRSLVVLEHAGVLFLGPPCAPVIGRGATIGCTEGRAAVAAPSFAPITALQTHGPQPTTLPRSTLDRNRRVVEPVDWTREHGTSQDTINPGGVRTGNTHWRKPFFTMWPAKNPFMNNIGR